MKLDVLGLLGACSYALDCVEAELVHVTSRHAMLMCGKVTQNFCRQ